MKPLFTGSEWSFELIEKTWKAIDKIGKEHFGLDYYEPQMEVISSEQMLDAYSSVAMPIMYSHWSFGKSFIENERAYKKGQQGLAYEVVINTNPCLTYLMEDNSMTMQALVMAHAACGHSSFFKNNYLFKEWTDADSILDYLKYAKNYIKSCEEKYGELAVTFVLDACHSLKNYGVDKYKRPPKLKKEVAIKKEKERELYQESLFNDLWRTVGEAKVQEEVLHFEEEFRLPEENLLYLIEKHSPILSDWAKEIVRIVRKVAQYFYPQMQTQVMNEGWATFCHYNIMTEMNNQGLITDGSYLEFLQSHTGVITQLPYTHEHYSGINVYALGFAMMMDIKRICEEPTDEDRRWFPDIVDTDAMTTLKDIVESYRDESFILQFLSPKVIRDLKLFSLLDDADNSDEYVVTHVHDDDDILNIRKLLSRQYSLSHRLPQIEVTGVDLFDNELDLSFIVENGRLLNYKETKKTISYLEALWGAGTSISLMYYNPDGSEYVGHTTLTYLSH